jgi:chromosome segregation ATPase
MKRSLASVLIATGITLFMMSQAASAQSPAKAGPTSEQSLEALVNEVRQLRAMLLRLNKGQVMLERLKLEQDQVARLSRELNNVTDTLNEIRLQRGKLQRLLPGLESAVEAGAIDKKDLVAMKADLDACTQREQMLVERATQLSSDLNNSQSRLTTLSERLNALELELGPRLTVHYSLAFAGTNEIDFPPKPLSSQPHLSQVYWRVES